MANFNNLYGSIITNGLGTDACCGLITMGFGLFKCTAFITPVEPPPSKGGGGGTHPVASIPGVSNVPFVPQHREIYQPLTPVKSEPLRQVKLVLQLKNGKKHERYFMVGNKRADQIVKATKIINSFAKKMGIVASNIKRRFLKAKTFFNK